MSTIEQLNNAAAMIEKLASHLEGAEAQLEASAAEATQAKEAAAKAEATAKEVKVASAGNEVEIARLAKTAAAAVKDAGLLSNDDQADVFASKIMSHEDALNKLAEMSKYIPAPKVASVVVDDTVSETPSADEVWEKTAMTHLNNLGIG